MMPQSFPKLLGHSHRSQQLQVMAMSDPEKNHQNSRMQIVPMLGRHFFFFLMVGTNRSSLHKTAQLNLRDAKHPPPAGLKRGSCAGDHSDNSMAEKLEKNSKKGQTGNISPTISWPLWFLPQWIQKHPRYRLVPPQFDVSCLFADTFNTFGYV